MEDENLVGDLVGDLILLIHNWQVTIKISKN